MVMISAHRMLCVLLLVVLLCSEDFFFRGLDLASAPDDALGDLLYKEGMGSTCLPRRVGKKKDF
jgi:hypothetical protein